MNDLIVIEDTREKYPWDFSFHDLEVERTKLDTGDYSIKGFEEKFCIERKRNTGEIAGNLGKKAKQFEAELSRMSSFRFAYIICEFHLEDIECFPAKSGIPQKSWPYIRITPQFILSRLNKWSDAYGVEVIYAGDTQNAEEIAAFLIKDKFNELRS